MNDLSARIANLSPGMRKILAQRLGMTAGAASRPQTIPRRNGASARLSFAQERIWFLEQFEPASPTYHIYPAYRLKGALNVAALEESFSEMIRRHETLRTSFVARDGSPTQRISEAQPFKLAVLDLRSLDPATREEEVRGLATGEAQRPFDLATGPLLRAKLLRLAEQENVLLLTIHHIISDGWSMGVFFRELAALYEASAALPELPVQYADFAEWQRTWLSGDKLDGELAYWKQQLAGAPPALELTTDYPRPALQSYQGVTERLMLSKELTESLKQLSQRERVTPFMLFLTAFNTLLYRYTEQNDILVGTPIAGRHLTELEGLIGLFVNTLVLRTDLSGNPAFAELLQQVRRVTLDAYAHQDVPFEKLVDEIQPERNLSSSPLFQVMFDYQNKPNMAFKLAGLAVEYLAIERPTAIFDLALTVADLAPGFRLSLTYKTDLFESTTITWMLRRFAALLEAVVAAPEKRIAAFPLVNADEQCSLQGTSKWQAQCVHSLFESQAARLPHRIAVICGDQYLTYAELNRRANQLAGYLQSLNVGNGTCVGLCVERSLDIAVGLLGILKAGGVYVPLDPSYPHERLTFMVQDTRMPVILTQKHIAERLPASVENVKTVLLDADREVIARRRADNPANGPTPNDLAYVIYTSGSTGQPKGVLISHEMCVNHCVDMQEHFGIEAADKVLEFASINFDVSLEQMLPGLIAGATVLLRDGDVWSGGDFYRKLAESQTTVANLPTAYWQQVVQEGVQQQGSYALKLMIPGGEAVQPETARLWQKTPLRAARLLNAYGPTETTMTATTFAIPVAEEGTLKRIPIGRPLANRTFHILDARGAIVPPGIPGELHIGGPLLAWGYLNQPALTAEKFIPDSFSTVSGARLYRTGDRIRLMHDGNLEFLGRVDRQVKVRGYRIEPGEIEIALSQHPAVQASAVKVCEEQRGEKRLVAYVVTSDEHATTVSELRSFLTEKVPSYMVPAVFMVLESLPLTPNGKVNYRALPAPDYSRGEAESSFVGPRNGVEETLAGIWSKVLGVANVGVHDNFFALGGDSILGLQIIARANQAGLRLTPKQLFQFQTIAELAAVTQNSSAPQAEQGLVSGPVPLSAIQRWFFERDLAEPHHYNQSFIYDAPANVKPDLLAQAVQQVTLHHDALRLSFRRGEAGWEQFHRGPETVAGFEYVELSRCPPEEQRLAIQAKAAELQTGLNLEAGPLMRCALFDRGPATASQLLIVIHHLVVDGVSWRIIIEDLQTAYEQLERGERIVLPAKTTSFKQWLERLTQYARTDGELQRERDYWQQQQTGASLPVHFDGPNLTSSARVVRVSLDEEETRQLTQEVPQAYNTQINDVLLAAFLIAYRQWTGADRILIDLEGHGRESLFDDLDLTRTVGWFTTIFPVVLDSAATEPPAVLTTVKEHLRAIPNKGIGYGLLKYLSGEPLSEPRRAQVSFNYLGQFDQGMTASSPFRLSRDPSGAVCSPRAERAYLVEVNAMIVRKQLQVGWTYSQNVHSRAAMQDWAELYLASLQDLIRHCVSPDAGGFTPSDFPEADLDAGELQAVLVELAE